MEKEGQKARSHYQSIGYRCRYQDMAHALA